MGRFPPYYKLLLTALLIALVWILCIETNVPDLYVSPVGSIWFSFMELNSSTVNAKMFSYWWKARTECCMSDGFFGEIGLEAISVSWLVCYSCQICWNCLGIRCSLLVFFDGLVSCKIHFTNDDLDFSMWYGINLLFEMIWNDPINGFSFKKYYSKYNPGLNFVSFAWFNYRSSTFWYRLNCKKEGICTKCW